MSCADTCVVMDYDSYNDFARFETRRARKPHMCCECGAVIARGEQHEYSTGKVEGMFWQVRTCLICVEIRTAFSCGSWVYGDLWEAISDQLFPVWDEMKAIDCLAKLTTQPAIDKMRAEYACYLEDCA